MALLRSLRLRSAACFRFCASMRRSRAAVRASSRLAAASAVGPLAGTTEGLRAVLVDGGLGHSAAWASSAGGPPTAGGAGGGVPALPAGASTAGFSVRALSLAASSPGAGGGAGGFGTAGRCPPVLGGWGERGRPAPPDGDPGRPERLRPPAGRFFWLIGYGPPAEPEWEPEFELDAAASIASIWILSWGRETAPRILVPKRLPCSWPWPIEKKRNCASTKKVSGTPRTPNLVASSPPVSTTLGWVMPYLPTNAWASPAR